MMIGSGGAVASAQLRGAAVVTPSARGAGLLEFHQFDRLVAAGREAARALLEKADGDIVGRMTIATAGGSDDARSVTVPAPRETSVRHP